MAGPERHWFLLAAGLHLALLLLLSLGLAANPPLRDASADSTPVDFVNVSDVAEITTPPEPSLDAAPVDPGPPPPSEATEGVAEPQPQTPEQTVQATDTAPQDAVATVRQPTPPRRPPPPAPKAPQTFDTGAMADMLNRMKPPAPVKPQNTSEFARSIQRALPSNARLSARESATLEQAIRSQIDPCWNPPIGGADVATMTVVLKIRLKPDGTVVANPELISQSGATADNQAYAKAFVETARRAVLRCAPLQLPAAQYPYWREFELNFDPRLMT